MVDSEPTTDAPLCFIKRVLAMFYSSLTEITLQVTAATQIMHITDTTNNYEEGASRDNLESTLFGLSMEVQEAILFLDSIF